MMPMMGWGPMGYGWGGGLLGMLLMLLFLALIVGGVVLVVRSLVGQGPGDGGAGRGDSALDIVRRRYASGEISKEEFERMKADLR